MGLSWPLNCNSNYISLLPTHFLPSPAQPSTQTHCRARLLAVFGTHTPCWLQTTPSHVPSAENKGRMDKTNNGKKKIIIFSWLKNYRVCGCTGFNKGGYRRFTVSYETSCRRLFTALFEAQPPIALSAAAVETPVYDP